MLGNQHEKLKCSLALILQVSETLLEGRTPNLLINIPSFGVLMMVVESAV